MDENPPQKPTRKYKFKPKAQPRPAPLPQVKAEKVEDVNAAQASELWRLIHERSLMGKAKAEKKVHGSQIAFGMGASGPSLKSYGAPRRNNLGGGAACSSGLDDTEYEEPWDYYSNYLTIAPIRRPYSGDPAILDEEEFGEAAQNAVYDENSTTPAAELGLQEENVEPTMFFLQLPPLMPMPKRSAGASAPDAEEEDSKPKGRASSINKMARLDELPAGYMGKMLVYKSGAVKLKLGETLYDVSPGMDYIFAQDVVAVNTAEKRFCVVGEIEKGAQVALDVDSLVANLQNL